MHQIATPRIAGSIWTNAWAMAWFLARSISELGNRVYSLAIPWIVMDMTGSALYMNASWAVGTLPFVLLGPFVGALVDRLDRRRVMVVCDLAQALLVGLIPLLHAFGALRLWHLFAIGFASNCFGLAFGLVADFGLLPRLVPPQQLAAANSVQFALLNFAAVAGPFTGGLLIDYVTAPGALLIDSLSFLVSMAVILRLPVNFTGDRPGAGTSLMAGVIEGARFLIRDRTIGFLALGLCLTNLATGALTTTLTFFLGQEMGLSADQTGFSYSLIGGAAILGSFVAPGLIRRYAIGRSIVGVGILTAAALAGASLVGGTWQVVVLWFCLSTLAGTVCNIMTFTIRQKAIPDHLMGRVNAAFRTVLTLSFPLSAAVLGMLTEQAGARTSFGAAALIQLGAVALLWLSPVGRYHLPEETN